MGSLDKIHTLRWQMELAEHGYTVFTLREERPDDGALRWGWVINAAAEGLWVAHVGPWGPVEIEGIEEKMETFNDLTQARTWVEVEIARQWRQEGRVSS